MKRECMIQGERIRWNVQKGSNCKDQTKETIKNELIELKEITKTKIIVIIGQENPN